MNLIDTHFHLDYYKNHKYMYDQINDLQQYTLCVTNSPEIYHSCRKLYSESKYVKFGLGYNPQHCLNCDFSAKTFLHEFSSTRYIGEVGLDYSKRFIRSKKKQLKAFEFICQRSAEENKILSIHSRLAEKDVLNILRKCGVSKAILHWYSGDLEIMHYLLETGYYFSVNSSMCSTENGRKVILNIPQNRLLIESDGPFSKIESKKYTPLDLRGTYDLVGSVVGINNIASIVYQNFASLLSQ